MSSTYGISTNSSSLTLTDFLSAGTKEKDSILDTSTTAASTEQMQVQATNRKAKNAYGASPTSGVGQAALKKALAEMGASGNRTTFSDIAAYREGLETELSALMRIDLYEAGVSLDTEFSLNMTAEGEIQVLCNDPIAKERIQDYLAANPDVCEQFGYVQALSNLERAKQSPASASMAMGNFASTKKEIQLQSVEAFFDEALSSGMSYSALMANFNPVSSTEDASGSVSFYTGISYTV